MALGGAVDTVSLIGVVFRVVVFAISILGVEFKVVYVAVGDVVGVDVGGCGDVVVGDVAVGDVVGCGDVAVGDIACCVDVVGVDDVLERLLLLQLACLIQVRRKTSNVVHNLFCSNMLNVDRN